MKTNLKYNYKVVSFLELNKKIINCSDKKIGFTNGCFDILHKGHYSLFKFCKKHCDILIVATKNDSTNFVISSLAKSNFRINTIINRINNMNYSKAFKENGFDILINVESSILKSIEQETSILAPWPIAKLQTNPLKEIIGIKINDDSNIIGKSITEIELPSHCQLLLIIRSNGITDIPSGHKTIHSNDELIVLIQEGKKESVLEYLS